MGGEMAASKVELIFEDDGFRPEIGKQATEKLLKQDGVDIITGYIWSHVLLASSQIRSCHADKILISANAGSQPDWQASSATRTSSTVSLAE